jgi:hypothetical protein
LGGETVFPTKAARADLKTHRRLGLVVASAIFAPWIVTMTPNPPPLQAKREWTSFKPAAAIAAPAGATNQTNLISTKRCATGALGRAWIGVVRSLKSGAFPNRSVACDDVSPPERVTRRRASWVRHLSPAQRRQRLAGLRLLWQAVQIHVNDYPAASRGLRDADRIYPGDGVAARHFSRHVRAAYRGMLRSSSLTLTTANKTR